MNQFFHLIISHLTRLESVTFINPLFMHPCSVLHFTNFMAQHLQVCKITCEVGSNHKNMLEWSQWGCPYSHLAPVHESEKYLSRVVKTWKSSRSSSELNCCGNWIIKQNLDKNQDDLFKNKFWYCALYIWAPYLLRQWAICSQSRFLF